MTIHEKGKTMERPTPDTLTDEQRADIDFRFTTANDPVIYDDLIDGRHRESYNFHEVAEHLSKYGYSSFLVPSDNNGADFVSVPLSPVDKDGNTRRTLYVQLKSCLTVDQKYRDFPDLLMAFPHTWAASAKSRPAPGTERIWYLVPHEILVDIVARTVNAEKKPGVVSWKDNGNYFRNSISEDLTDALRPYRLNGADVQL